MLEVWQVNEMGGILYSQQVEKYWIEIFSTTRTFTFSSRREIVVFQNNFKTITGNSRQPFPNTEVSYLPPGIYVKIDIFNWPAYLWKLLVFLFTKQMKRVLVNKIPRLQPTQPLHTSQYHQGFLGEKLCALGGKWYE